MFRVRCVAANEDAGEWAEAMAGFDPAGGAVLKREGGAAVYRAEVLGRDVVLKSWEVRTAADRLKLAARMSRADRHWRGAQWLLGRGLDSAEPLALLVERGAGIRRVWLAMEALEGKTVLRHLADGDLSVKQEHALARELARVVQEMIAGGRWNRDFKPSNLIVTDTGQRGGGRARVATIDCVAILHTRGKRGESALRMYTSLAIEPAGVGRPVRRALACRFLVCTIGANLGGLGSRHAIPDGDRQDLVSAARRGKLWKSLWRSVRERIEAHGDPRPRTDPLSPPHHSPRP